MQRLSMCHGPRARFLASLIFSLTLAACGGGSDTPSRLDNIGGGGNIDMPGDGDGGGSAQLGRGSADNFVAGEIEVGIGDSPLSPGGETSLSVTLVNSAGELVTSAVNVTFDSECIADGSAQLIGTDNEGDNSVSTNNGRTTVTYRANGCVGEDQVTARATFQGVSTGSAQATLTVEQDTVQSLEFVDVDPDFISIRGTGGDETAEVTFRVLGSTGAPLKDIDVDFSLSTTAGGLTLEPAQATSDNAGEVTTIVQAGTVATSVRVRASTEGVDNQPLSDLLTVSTGIADQNSSSVAATELFPIAFNFNGVESQISMRLADAFNNPPPDGTAVSFTTSGGSIGASCTTVNGVCNVTWRSQNPKPQSNFTVDESTLSIVCPGEEDCRGGRVKVLATVIGNESFGDDNGNGRYDGPGVDTFNTETGDGRCSPAVPTSTASAPVGGASCDDLGEAYLDSNFNDTREADGQEPFVDLNNNGVFDSSNGIYDGALCSEEAQSAGECTTNSVSVRDDLLLVMTCEDPLLMDDGRLPGQQNLSLAPGQAGAVTMLLADCNGNGMPSGTTVELDTESLQNAEATTNLGGELAGSAEPTFLQVIVTTDDTDPAGGFIRMNITSPKPGGGSKTVRPAAIGVLPGDFDGGTDSAQLGRGNIDNFTPGEIEVGNGGAEIPPGGETSLSVTLVDSNGELVTSPVSITFNSNCIADGRALLEGTDFEGGNSVTTNTGRATVTYQANGCAGEDQVTASAFVQGVPAETAQATLIVQQDTVQSLEFINAQPELVSIKGTGGDETSDVTFQVLGSTGDPLAGIVVNFALSTTAGGLTLVNEQATSNQQGEVSTTVQAGTVATSVRVIASTEQLSNDVLSSRLVVSTGIPDQNSSSVSATDLFPVAWNFDGIESQITMRLADAFNNPPPDGTAVSFTTSGGAIDASCTTVNGVCNVIWRSQNPKPVPDQGFTVNESTLSIECPGAEACRPGRVKVLATVVGNESFGDDNGNGRYDGPDVDTFNPDPPPEPEDGRCSPAVPRSTASVGSSGCDDLGEAYLDSNFNGTREANGLEPFVDFDNSGSFDLRNKKYDGALCSEDAEAADNCTKNSVSVRDDLLLVMTCEEPLVMNDGGLPGQQDLSLSLGETASVTMLLADCNGNGLPPGTTVSLNTSNLENAQADTNLDSALSGSSEPRTLQVFVTADDSDPASGAIFINITAPTINGDKTTTPAGISVN